MYNLIIHYNAEDEIMNNLHTKTPLPKDYSIDDLLNVSPLTTLSLDESKTLNITGVLSSCIAYNGTPIIYFGDERDIDSRSQCYNVFKGDSVREMLSEFIPDFKDELLDCSSAEIAEGNYIAIHRKSDEECNDYVAVVPCTLDNHIINGLLTNRTFVYITTGKYIEFEGYIVPQIPYNKSNSRFYSPSYINCTEHKLVVADDGITLLHIESLRKVDFIQLKAPLAPNTQITLKTNPFTKSSNEFAELYLTQELNEQKAWFEKERERKRKLKEREDALAREKIKEEDAAFNKSLNLPFKYTLGYKVVLSGLSSSSWGDGARSNTVTHIVLDEDCKQGRLSRNKGDFLCKASSSKMWEQETGGRVTCSQCLKIASRWKS